MVLTDPETVPSENLDLPSIEHFDPNTLDPNPIQGENF